MDVSCIACGCHRTYPVYHPDDHPLSVLDLPRTAEEARAAPRLPMNFRACAHCGHIFNVEFDYERIPYNNDSNLMYNAAPRWVAHMEELIDGLLSRYDLAGATLVDIGCGDGGFLKLLMDRGVQARCVGFEPGMEADSARENGLEVYRDYFIPERDLAELRPDFLICRHVLEHMPNPRQFVFDIAFWANLHDVSPVFLAEVPRIDNAVKQLRINDFLFEHPSNFTQFSFENMFASAGFEVLESFAAYGSEVTCAFVQPARMPHWADIRQASHRYAEGLSRQVRAVRAGLDRLGQMGRSVAFWGATGKGASFLNAFGLDGGDWPVVVDSDAKKVGRFVPGCGQEIRGPEHLLDHPVDAIVITTQWRARDIAEEIERRGIVCEALLVVRDGKLQCLQKAPAGCRETLDRQGTWVDEILADQVAA